MSIKKVLVSMLSSSVVVTGLYAGLNNPNVSLNSSSLRASVVGSLTTVGTQTVAATGECSANQFYITGQVTGTTDDGGGNDNLTCEVWDDGELKDSATISIPVGQTIDVNISLAFQGLYGTGAAGVGISCAEVSYYEDPFYPVDIVGSCTAADAPVVAVPISNAFKLILALLFAMGASFFISKRES